MIKRLIKTTQIVKSNLYFLKHTKMKKNLIVAFMLFFSVLAHSQLNFGIKVGYNSSLSLNNVSSITSGSYNLKSVNADLANGFNVGVFGRIPINNLYFQPELLYNFGSKNYTVTGQDASSNNVSFGKDVKISTIDIPLLVGYKILDLKVCNLRAFAGPKLRFNAGSTLDFTKPSDSKIDLTTLEKDIKSSQIGLEAGVGIDILMFTLDARYSLINDMYQTKLSSVTLDKLSANTFVISLGWKF
jgi:hypothetical protein